VISSASGISQIDNEKMLSDTCRTQEQVRANSSFNISVNGADVYLEGEKVDEINCGRFEEYDFPNSGQEWYEDPNNLFYIFVFLAFSGLAGFIFWSYRYLSIKDSIKIPSFLSIFSYIWLTTVFRSSPEFYTFLIGTVFLPLLLIYVAVRDSERPYKKEILIGSLLSTLSIVSLLLILFTSTTPA